MSLARAASSASPTESDDSAGAAKGTAPEDRQAGQSGEGSQNAGDDADDEGKVGAVVCKCRNVTLRVRLAREDGDVEEESRSSGQADGQRGEGTMRGLEMVVSGPEIIRHKPCATYEPAQSAQSTGTNETERQSRRPSSIVEASEPGSDAEKDSATASGAGGSGGRVVRRCWICEADLYTATGKGRDGVMQEGERVWVDMGSETYFASYQPTEAAQTFSTLTLELPATSSSFGRPPSSAVSSSTLYPALSPNTLAAHRTSSLHPSSGHSTSSASAQSQSSSRPYAPSHTHPLLPRLADPFFLPPPFTPSHPLLTEWCASAVAFLHGAQETAERDVRQYIEVKAREMARVQEETRKEVEMLWNKYAQGPGREEEVERRRRSRSVSVSRRASRGAGAAAVGGGAGGVGRKASGLQTQVHSGMPGKAAGSALETDEDASPGGGLSPLPSPMAQPQPTDNPILRETISQTPYTGGSLLSASISRNSYMPSALSPAGSSSSPSAAANTDSASNTARAAAAADNDIDDLSQTLPLQGDQRAVAMSYVFSGMDEMEKRRQQAQAQAQGRRASGSRDRRERERQEVRQVDEAVDQVQKEQQQQQQGMQKDVHGKDSWIDEERNLAARYTAHRAAGSAKGSGAVVKETPEALKDVENNNDEQREDEQNGDEGEMEGKTPKATQGQGQRPRVTFQEPKPIRELKDREGVEVGGDDEESGADAGDVEDEEGGGDEDNVFDFELEDTAPQKINGSATSAFAKAPARPKVQDMYESLLSTTLASDIPSHRAAHQRMKATGHNPYEFLRRRVSGASAGDDDSLDGSDGSGSGIGTPRGSRDGSRSLLATSMPVKIVLPHRTSSRSHAGLPPLEPKTSLSERQGLLVPGLRGAMRMTPSMSASGQGSRGMRGDGGGGDAYEEQDGTPEATPRARNQLQGMSTATLARSTDPSDTTDQRHTQTQAQAQQQQQQQPLGSGRTRRGSRSASVSRERETFRQDPGAVLELVGEADDGDADGDLNGGRGRAQSGSPDDAEDGAAGVAPGVPGRERRESEMNKRGRGFMPPHIIARQESARSGDVGWRSMVED